ncbi:hypothetical protein [Paenibacillus koleovorans]|uniref:hypothetical protein n=1 Tax=Paenibacillus koleovorans TaxID=121608 RepID=UPI000FDC8116|nr:hypothetical protein [Paenibacillus koleovorans]
MKSQMKARYEQYLALIYEQGITSIANIAFKMQLSRKQVVANELERMAYLGLLPNASVDVKADMVIVHHPYNNARAERELAPSYETKPTSSARPQPKQVECPNCGAPGQLYSGESKECEYCRSMLQ